MLKTASTGFIYINIDQSYETIPEGGHPTKIQCQSGVSGKPIECHRYNTPSIVSNNYDDVTSPRLYYRSVIFIDFSSFKGGSDADPHAIIPVATTGPEP